MDYFVHESSYVDEGARIGPDTKIWHFSHVMGSAEIGAACSIGQNVFVGEQVKLGDGVKVQNNVSIYEGVVLEDFTFCGPSMVFTNVKTPRSKFPRKRESGYQETRVQYGATIGANATVVCGTNIGRWALVAAGAVVNKDIPDYGLVAGVPGRLIGWACACGVRLEFTNGSANCACGRAYARLSDEKISAVANSDG